MCTRIQHTCIQCEEREREREIHRNMHESPRNRRGPYWAFRAGEQKCALRSAYLRNVCFCCRDIYIHTYHSLLCFFAREQLQRELHGGYRGHCDRELRVCTCKNRKFNDKTITCVYTIITVQKSLRNA